MPIPQSTGSALRKAPPPSEQPAATYQWDLATDRLSWSPNLADVIGPELAARLRTGRALVAATSSDSLMSLYDAVAEAERAGGLSGRYRLQYGLVASGAGTVWVNDAGRCTRDRSGRVFRAGGAVRVLPTAQPIAPSQPVRGQDGCLDRPGLLCLLAEKLAQPEPEQGGFALLLLEWGGAVPHEERLAQLRKVVRGADVLASLADGRIAVVLNRSSAHQLPTALTRITGGLRRAQGSNPPVLRAGGVLGFRHARSPHLLLHGASEALKRADPERGWSIYDPAETSCALNGAAA